MKNATRQGGVIEANSGVHYTGFANVTPQVIDEFRQAMSIAGIYYSGDIFPDGKLHRIHINGHKRSTRNGAYCLHIDNHPAGYFQDYKSGISNIWRASGSHPKITYEQRKQIAEAKRNRHKEMLQKQAQAANKAAYIWSRSKPITKKEDHPYLVKKRINPGIARAYKNALVVPIFNKSNLVNLQFISEEGEKRFLSGGEKKGCYATIAGNEAVTLICEGYATGCSLYEHSSNRVVIAFDAGNLALVAKNIRSLSPDNGIIVCGDNDTSGVGQSKAAEAAKAVNGKVLIPPMEGCDWNDYLRGDYA